MNRLDEYLNGLDKKNVIMLYVSVFILAFIIYYNFNYSVLSEKITGNENKIYELRQKLKENLNLSVTLKSLKSKLRELKKNNSELTEDLKYLNMLIATSPVLHINDVKFLEILKSLLEKAVANDIEASYFLNKKLNEYKVYEIDIEGFYTPEHFEKFYRFVKSLEKIRVIKEVKYLKFVKGEDVFFKMEISFWGLR